MVVGRTDSSVVSPASGATSASKAPADHAAAALPCDSAAKASIASRLSDHLAAISSALMPCGTSPPGKRAATPGPNGSAPGGTLDHMGTRLIDSTPQATTTSYAPATTPCAAKCTACWEEPHCRSTVVAGTESGKPADSQAQRVVFMACSPTWSTVPPMTSSTSAGSIPLRPTSSLRVWASSSTGCVPASAPPGLPLPMGVRTASTMTASRMTFSPSAGCGGRDGG